MAFISQDGQDKYLEENVFKGFKNGFFVDVGAHDGISINNTLYFETKNNWTGINIEPLPEVFKKLEKNRPKCINLNLAVDNVSEDMLESTAEFYMNTGYTEMISGLTNYFDPRHLNRLNNENRQKGSHTQKIMVKTKSLKKIFEENNVTHINYLSIDVEGAEFPVILSIDFNKVFIDIIGFENNYNDVSVPIIKYLNSKGFNVIKRSLDIFMINKNSKFNTF